MIKLREWSPKFQYSASGALQEGKQGAKQQRVKEYTQYIKFEIIFQIQQEGDLIAVVRKRVKTL